MRKKFKTSLRYKQVQSPTGSVRPCVQTQGWKQSEKQTPHVGWIGGQVGNNLMSTAALGGGRLCSSLGVFSAGVHPFFVVPGYACSLREGFCWWCRLVIVPVSAVLSRAVEGPHLSWRVGSLTLAGELVQS